MTDTKKDNRQKTVAVAIAAERIADRVEANHWSDEEGMNRLKALTAIDTNDPEFFKKVDESGREPASATQ